MRLVLCFGLLGLLASACGADPEESTGDSGNAAGGSGGGGQSTSASYCDDRVCGADWETGEWCGSACEVGKGCGSDGTCGDWPPELDSIYNGNEDWQLPPCELDVDAGSPFEGAAAASWIKTMTTTATDCVEAVQAVHPMLKPGNVATEDTSVPAIGSCLQFSSGQWGTALEGYALWGASWPSQLGEFSYRINWRALINHNLSPPSGKGVVHLSQLPSDYDCSVEMDVTYERCPEDRDDCGNHPAPF